MRALIPALFVLLSCAHPEVPETPSDPVFETGSSKGIPEVDYRWGQSDFVEYFGIYERRDYHLGRLERVLNFDPEGRLLEVEEFDLESNSESGTGPQRSYFSDGKLRREVTLINGKREGVERVFFPDGKLRESSEWKLDRREGVYREFYPNGKLRLWANYEQGVMDGVVKTFAESGMLIQEATFSSGKKEGLEQTYFVNGYFRSRTQYHSGRWHGGAEAYTPEGHLLWRHRYQNGRRVSA